MILIYINAVKYGERVVSRLVGSRLPTNLAHGLLLQLQQIKRTQPQVVVTGCELVNRLVAACSCPLVSAQYITLVNMDQVRFYLNNNRGEIMRPFLQP